MNPSLQKLLASLADGKYHSGESLGQLLGVSRAAVWKQLQQLQELGVDIVSHKGRGYCVAGGLDLLHEKEIKKLYKQYSISQSANGPREIMLALNVDSTSQVLLRRSAEGESIHGLVCLAEKQTAGRGRRGRAWQSPIACNLYFSIGWRIENGVNAIEGLSLAAGVAINTALQEMGLKNIQLKWPNDLLYQGKKLGGILLEINGDAAGECDLVLGLGINVDMPAEASSDIDQAWTDLTRLSADLGVEIPVRNRLVAQLLVQLFNLLENYESKGFSHYKNAWQELNAHIHQPVVLNMGNKQVRGVVEGVSDGGALRLNVNGKIEEFIGGEISLRPAQ